MKQNYDVKVTWSLLNQQATIKVQASSPKIAIMVALRSSEIPDNAQITRIEL